MSIVARQTKEKIEFIARFIELCGTKEPAKIQRLLQISYQSAKNYLTGRYPDPEILVGIGLRTGCSIDWLLTGRGEKFADPNRRHYPPLSTDQIESVRKICEEVITERLGDAVHLKTVKLQPSEIMTEKVLNESGALHAVASAERYTQKSK